MKHEWCEECKKNIPKVAERYDLTEKQAEELIKAIIQGAKEIWT